MEEFSIKRIKLLLLAFLVITIGSCIGTAAEIHVQPGGSNPIQAAIANASSGDTIIVAPGIYVGNIDISRTNALNDLVLMSESGNPKNTVIVADNTAATTVRGVISITKYKTNVVVKGFTISGARELMAGVYLDQGRQCIIENNVFMDNGYGVSVSGGSGNTISNNTVNRTRGVAAGTTYTGISVSGSSNSIVSQNKISNNNNGIRVAGSSRGSVLSENSANNNAQNGIILEGSKGITIEGNTLNSNDLFGIQLSASSDNYVTNNKVVMAGTSSSTGSFTNGIQLIVDINSVGSDSNVVSGNTVSNAAHGIFSNGCRNNTIQNNRVFDNNYGIAMRYSHNNRVLNNNVTGNTNGNNGEGIFLTYLDSGNTVSGNIASECNRGIELSPVCGENNLVENNVINSNQYYGIYALAPNNKISKNSLSQNRIGIYIEGPSGYGYTVSDNIIKEGSGSGISLVNTSNNKIVSNDLISNGGQKGIELVNSNNNNLDSNYALDNDMGIQLQNSNGVTVNNNTAYQNRIGIRVYYSSNNVLSRNNATYNGESGIDFNSAVGNNITGNSITWNDKHGISMCAACRDNLVYDNYFLNDMNTGIQNAQNTWHLQLPVKGKNVMSGPYIGGNFWASPDGEGFSEKASDMNGDGISDTIYSFTNAYGITIIDTLPLAKITLPVADFSFTPAQGVVPLSVQFTDLSKNTDSRVWNFGDGASSNVTNPSHTYATAGTFTVTLTASNKNSTVSKSATVIAEEFKVLPVADFSAVPTSGYAPLAVQFTDSSQNAAGWSWTFGDGASSSEQSPSHSYSAEGTYTVKLVVNNANGTASKETTITVFGESSSSGGSSGGSSHSSSGGSGGGGAGGSPEPQSNVEIKELSQIFITKGNPVKFDFPQKATAVESITFDSKKTVGKTTTIAEMLKNKSTLVSSAPSNEVYKYLNIWVGNGGYATETNIENAVVSFKVAKSWVQDKKVDESSIILNRYSDAKWNSLPTSLSGEDDSYLHFTATTPGFSPFAITGKSTATGTIQPAVDKPQTTTVSEPQKNTTTASTSNGSTPAKTEKTPEKKQSTSLPGFEAVFAIAGLLAVFMFRRK